MITITTEEEEEAITLGQLVEQEATAPLEALYRPPVRRPCNLTWPPRRSLHCLDRRPLRRRPQESP